MTARQPLRSRSAPVASEPGAGRPIPDADRPVPDAGRPVPDAGRADPDTAGEQLYGIGTAAQKAGVSQRALRYYQQLGLITPHACTPGGLRRYCDEDLARVSRIRQLQTLLGLNLDEIAIMLRSEDRMAEIRLAYHAEATTCSERRDLVRESLELQQELRATVEAKRLGIEGFLTDLDARIAKTRSFLEQMTDPAPPPQVTKAGQSGS
jgi:MerR family transcriptional regulator, repressor of the yfmOP operon